MPPAGRTLAFALAAAAVVVLLLVYAALIAPAARRYRDYLSGFWVGAAAFLPKAQLSDMQLYLAPPEGGVRQGYLLMVDDAGAFVANCPIELRGAPRPWSAARATLAREGDRCAFPALELELEAGAAGPLPPIPAALRGVLSVLDGSLTLYDGEKVYAFLYKDAQASDAANGAYRDA